MPLASMQRPGRRQGKIWSLAHVIPVFALFFVAAISTLSQGAVAQPIAAETEPESTFFASTDSPQDTLRSFLTLRDQMERALLDYIEAPTMQGVRGLALLSDQMVAMIDLEQVSSAARREVGIKTATYLMDILGRLPTPDVDALPSTATPDLTSLHYVRIPDTPLRILLMSEGPREGEFLFSAQTVQAAPRFLRGLGDLPLRTDLRIQSFSALSPQLTGPLFPPDMVAALPPRLLSLWYDTPIWKVLVMVALALIGAGLVALVNRAASNFGADQRIGRLMGRSLVPLTMLTIILWALPSVMQQLNLSGAVSFAVEGTLSVLAHVGFAWLFWLAVRLAIEWVILSPRIPDESLDANLLRLLSGLVGIIGVAIILAFAGQAIGLPIVSVLAGLGIGGLAVALALRPTLENLVGGVMLYIDRPARVGDFCCFSGEMGTVEEIGIRSTRIRALDRTVITVPNAQFADMQITNLSRRDQILVDETIGLRYDTSPDFMRTFLARAREMLLAEPTVDPETVRVRFMGYDDSTLKVNVRVYIRRLDFEEFLAIREGLFLAIYDLVKEVGADFAYPSQTLYLSRDGAPRGALPPVRSVPELPEAPKAEAPTPLARPS